MPFVCPGAGVSLGVVSAKGRPRAQSTEGNKRHPLFVLTPGRVRCGGVGVRVRRRGWAGRPLPSIRTSQQRYEVSDGTVKKAVQVLRDEGLVRTVIGRGVCVGPRADG